LKNLSNLSGVKAQHYSCYSTYYQYYSGNYGLLGVVDGHFGLDAQTKFSPICKFVILSNTTKHVIMKNQILLLKLLISTETLIGQPPKMNNVLYGAAYYQEYMPSDRLADDLKLMKESGFQTLFRKN
jgi:hypothetical protein